MINNLLREDYKILVFIKNREFSLLYLIYIVDKDKRVKIGSLIFNFLKRSLREFIKTL